MKINLPNRLLFLVAWISLSNLADGQSTVNYPESLRQLHRNVIDHILADNADNARATEILAQLNDQGYWPDIDYTSQERGGWPPAEHLSRLLVLAQAYRTARPPHYANPELSKKIHAALDYWLENDLICPNWWYPEIGVPMRLAPTLFLLEAELSTEQKEKARAILDRAQMGKTGQNKVWLAGNVLFRSLLFRDEPTIRQAAAAIQEELRAGDGEGIQPDWSFHQHGPQLQFGNYGLSYAGSMIQWIALLRNTPFAFEESKVSVLRHYLLEGLRWVSWKGRLDISACGRQLFPDSPRQKAENLARAMRDMGEIDPPFARVYQEANQYATLSGNKLFWRSDFQTHRRPEFYFSVKMCSQRVVGAESCNSENLLGYFLGDGATYLYQTGREYENIFPFWDWKKVPGTTAIQDDEPLPVLTCQGYRLETDFVGGVSDGALGVAALDYARDGLKAKKSWFMFSDLVICLGAGISSSENFPVTTSVNQVFLQGQTVVKEDRRRSLENGAWTLPNPKWVWHDYTGYFFPAGGDLRVENQSAAGSWHDVAARFPDDQLKSEVFRLWFDHGRRPANGSYAYALVPNATIKDLEKMEHRAPFRVVHNNENLQAVISADSSMGGVVFYSPGTAQVFGGITANSPCVILLQKENGNLRVHLADPTQKLEKIQLSFQGCYAIDDNATLLAVDEERSILTAKLPQGPEAGKTVSFRLNPQ